MRAFFAAELIVRPRARFTPQLYTLGKCPNGAAGALRQGVCDAGITLLFGKLYRLNAFFVCSRE